MRDHRQGNDLAVVWSILRDGKPFILSGKEWKLYLKNMYERKEVDDFSVKGNQIHWTFYGKDQKTTGRYSLILVGNENEKGMITTDTCNFVNVVSCSCKVQNSEDSPNVEIETIELTSNLDYVAGTGGEGGGGDYDDSLLWEALNDKVDKVDGKGLSSNDFTDAYVEQLASLDDTYQPKGDYVETKNLATINGKPLNEGGDIEIESGSGGASIEVDSSLSTTSTNPVQNKVITAELNKKAETGAIPTKLSQLTDNVGFAKQADVEAGYQPKGDYVTDDKLSSKGYATEKYVDDALEGKQDTIEDLDSIRSGAGKGATAVQPSALEDYATTQQLTELSAEVSKKQDTITDLETIRSGAAKGATALQSVPDTYATKTYVDDAIKDIPAPTPSASNEWKCVVDRRLLEGEKKIIFTTYADGTPLNAKEVVVQLLCDTSSQKGINGYVVIQSTNNKTMSSYGAIQFERNAASSQNQILDQMHLKASPMYMVAEIYRSVKCAIASPVDQQAQGGSVPFQIYEDIVYIELAPNEALTSAAPLVKIYAR